MVVYVDRIEGDPPGMDPADHPRFAESLRFEIDVAVERGVAGVLAGQRVEVLAGALGDEFGVAADLDEPGGVAGIDDEQADLLVLEQVAAFLSLEGRVYRCAAALVVASPKKRIGRPTYFEARQSRCPAAPAWVISTTMPRTSR